MRKRQLESMGVAGKVHDVQLVDVYTIDAPLQKVDLQRVGSMLADAVTERATVDVPQAPEHFDWAIEIGYHPGVTDNVATTAREGVEDLLKTKLEEQQGVYSSQVTFMRADLSQNDVRMIAESLANPLIQRTSIKRFDAFQREQGMGIVIPRVRLGLEPAVSRVDLLQATNEELALIGKKGIANVDGTRRGPLALDLTYMKAVQTYFRGMGRNPTDVELESVAQTWSEHCKHTIFADSLDGLTEGLFRTYIQGAAEKIRRAKGDKDFCVSVFKDNSGAIAFDDEWLLTDKVETHNSPSALDPFGGAITGIVGVNRDTIGFGLGARPVINRYAFCFGYPEDKKLLFRGKDKTNQSLTPKRIMEGVIKGVNFGGNCSGISTPQGFVYFDKDYKGKPLVFVGTIGLISRLVGKNKERQGHLKKAKSGD